MRLFRRRRRFTATTLLPSGERREAELLARDLASVVALTAQKEDPNNVELIVVARA